MLRFNSFRARRYLRSRFIEGRYLLASEATDLELEILDILRGTIKETIGDVAVGDAWKLEKLNATDILVNPGEAWFDGLPFELGSSKDQLVSGSILSEGITPQGITILDDPQGRGKIIRFNDGATTPTDNYRIVLTAQEEIVTSQDDPFLQNANLPESTSQKVRLNIRINVVEESRQTKTPTPYTNDTSDENLVNEIIISPTSGGNGELIQSNSTSSSAQIDGRNLELIVRNDPAIGGGNPIPNGSSDQQRFANGKLIDSNGTEYHINQVFTDTITTRAVIRIDKEVGQPDPELNNGDTYTLVKNSTYVTDSTNGVPQGKLFWAIGKLNWDSSTGIAHQSDIEDLRQSIDSLQVFQDRTNTKFDLVLTRGGNINFNSTTSILSWDANFAIVNPHGSTQFIQLDNVPILEDGALAYTLDFTGGFINEPHINTSYSNTGSTLTLNSADLSEVKIGNVVKNGAGDLAHITDIDDENDQITISASFSSPDSLTIYKNSFAAGFTPKSSLTFILAARNNNKVYIGDNLELENGETSQVGDGISTQLLTLLGSGITESTENPTYSSDIRGTAGEGFQERIGVLTDAEGDNQEDRSAFLRSDSLITWTGNQLEFSSDIVLETINTKSGTITNQTLSASHSPITLNDGELLYLDVDRTTSASLAPIIVTQTPAQNQNSKDVFVLFKRRDAAGVKYLHLPFTKQLLTEGQTVRLGASGTGGGGPTAKTTFFDPVSSSLPSSDPFVADGVTVQTGDTVLFTNLSTGNNRIYEATISGGSISWDAQRAFNFQFDPTDGDTARILKGDAYQDQLAVFNGTDFKINDIVRYFDGTDYWEVTSIKTLSLTNNTTDNIFSVNVTGSENMSIRYSILRGATKETGILLLTSDGTDSSLSRQASYIGDTGIEFNTQINAGNLELNYTSDNSGAGGTLKYFIERWSNAPGGPTGIPNYSSAGSSSSTAAAGNLGEIQYHGSSGNLEADSRFSWNTTKGAVELNGLDYQVLSSNISLNDNQTTPLQIIDYDAATYRYAILEYALERGSENRVGRILVPNNGTVASISDDFVETGNTGITFSATISGSNVSIRYTSTNTGNQATFNYTIRKWN